MDPALSPETQPSTPATPRSTDRSRPAFKRAVARRRLTSGPRTATTSGSARHGRIRSETDGRPRPSSPRHPRQPRAAERRIPPSRGELTGVTSLTPRAPTERRLCGHLSEQAILRPLGRTVERQLRCVHVPLAGACMCRSDGLRVGRPDMKRPGGRQGPRSLRLASAPSGGRGATGGLRPAAAPFSRIPIRHRRSTRTRSRKLTGFQLTRAMLQPTSARPPPGNGGTGPAPPPASRPSTSTTKSTHYRESRGAPTRRLRRTAS
jgi:hypothetical protein